MLEPFSLTVGIIAVIRAADSIVDTLNNIRGAPEDLLALINEVSDLKIVLQDVDQYLAEDPQECSSPHAKQLRHLSTLVDQAKCQLSSLDSRMNTTFIKSAHGRNSISRIKWFKAQDSIAALRRALRETRINVATQLAVINSSQQFHTGLVVDEISLTSSRIRNEQVIFREQTTQRFDHQSRLLTQLLESQLQMQEMLRIKNIANQSNLLPSYESAISESEKMHSSVICVKAYVPARQHSPCITHCKCECHLPRRFRSPRLFDAILGPLFAGYSGRPFRNFPKCNVETCLGQPSFKFHVKYYFPSWFLGRMLAVQVDSRCPGEPSIGLTIRRTVPSDAEIFRLTSADDADGLQRLFASRSASPNDILYVSGMTALHISLTKHCMKACKVLLDAGADPLFENNILRTPFHQAWDMIFQASKSSEFAETLRSLFPDDDHLEERQFSKLHKVVLGITHHDLKKAAMSCGVDIDLPDSQLRTALSWAAERGDVSAVRILLETGADPDRLDSTGRGPLYYAARSSFKCVKLLLDAGADPQQTNKNKYNALHCATVRDEQETIRILVSAGTNINGKSILGSTPLANAAARNFVVSSKVLLECGADPNSVDNEGDTPLCEAVFHRAHGVLRLLFQNGSIPRINHGGNTILHYAAGYGDLETIQILKEFVIPSINPDFVNKQGKSALDLAQERKILPGNFLCKFKALLEAYRVETRKASGTGELTAYSNHKSAESRGLLSEENSADDEDVFTDALEEQE